MKGTVIESKERTILLLSSVIIVILSLLPNVAGFLIQTPEMRFNGAAFNWPDVATHLVAIRSGMQGSWHYRLFFTPLPQEGHYIKLFYIAMGNLFRVTRLSPLIVYYISLTVLNLAVCLLLYRFITEFFTQPKYRVTAFLLAIFASGLGWLMNSANLLPKAGYTPIDLWLIDAYPYFSMIVFPHFSAVILGQLGFILLFMRYQSNNRSVYFFWMALIGLALQAIQPYAPLIPFLVVGGMVLGNWISTKIFPKKLVMTVSLVGIAQLPLLVYTIIIFKNDPVWADFASQNQTLSPPPAYYLWGFIWFWLLLLPAFSRKNLFLDAKRISLLAWIFGVLILAYLPWNFQRRFLLYFTVPLSILTTLVIQDIISPWLDRHISFLRHRKTTLLFLLLFITSFSNFYLVYTKIAAELPQHSSTQYHPEEIKQALSWLQKHTRQNTIMISAPRTGLLAGVQAEQTVFVTHQFETVGYQKRIAQVEQFYCNKIQLTELETAEVEWIFYGPYEREICTEFQPPTNFRIVYQLEGVNIYQLEHDN